MTEDALCAEFLLVQTILRDIAVTTRSAFALCRGDGTALHIDGPASALHRAANAGFTVGAKLDVITAVLEQLSDRNTFGLRSSSTRRHKAGSGWFCDCAAIHDLQTGRPLGAVVLAGGHHNQRAGDGKPPACMRHRHRQPPHRRETACPKMCDPQPQPARPRLPRSSELHTNH